MLLHVYWGREEVGMLEQVEERSREYRFRYTHASRPISLSLPLKDEPFSASESRPFFEALLPEGTVRERIANQLKLASSDSFGLLAELGRDCAGALQVLETTRMSETPSVEWLDEPELDDLIEQLPRHPLGVQAGEDRLRLSLAGVQDKAVLIRSADERFGKPLDGMPSTHILKPELPGNDYPGLARNEYFCMRLADRCGLGVARVELAWYAGRACLVVERFDRDRAAWPPARLHQEDLCQALGLTPEFKYQRAGWRLPSYRALAELLDLHSRSPGVDRLSAASAAIFHFLVGNADAHAKNISLMHDDGAVRLAPLYDVVSTTAYRQLSDELALSVGDELDPDAITPLHWSDLADDFGLNKRRFERARAQLAERVRAGASRLAAEARAEGWHHPCIESILETIEIRSARVG
jgi:serine/threonine-protein kinase HipA